MRYGELKQQASIQQPVVTSTTGTGEPVVSWQAWRENVFCSVEVKRGARRFEEKSKSEVLQSVYRFRFIYIVAHGIKEEMRILYAGQPYRIVALLPDESERRYIDVDALRVDGEV